MEDYYKLRKLKKCPYCEKVRACRDAIGYDAHEYVYAACCPTMIKLRDEQIGR